VKKLKHFCTQKKLKHFPLFWCRGPISFYIYVEHKFLVFGFEKRFGLSIESPLSIDVLSSYSFFDYIFAPPLPTKYTPPSSNHRAMREAMNLEPDNKGFGYMDTTFEACCKWLGYTYIFRFWFCSLGLERMVVCFCIMKLGFCWMRGEYAYEVQKKKGWGCKRKGGRVWCGMKEEDSRLLFWNYKNKVN